MKHYTTAESTTTLPLWHCTKAKIERDFVFKNFSECFGFMSRVALLCEAANHHPFWTNEYNKLHIELNTHSEKAVTEKDIALAQKIDELLA